MKLRGLEVECAAGDAGRSASACDVTKGDTYANELIAKDKNDIANGGLPETEKRLLEMEVRELSTHLEKLGEEHKRLTRS